MLAFLRARLGRRFLAALLISLGLSSCTMLVCFVAAYRARLVDEHVRASAQINELLQSTLENAMLKRDLEGLRAIVLALGHQAEIAAVTILEPHGEIRFASEPERVGRRATGLLPASGTARTASTRFVRDEAGREVLRSINPVENRPTCVGCHGPIAENPVNGVLVVDYLAGGIRREALEGALALGAAGGVVMLIAFGALGGVLYRSVLRPVAELDALSARYAAGDLSPRFDGKGEDELTLLGLRYNQMAETLGHSIAALRADETFLQSLLDALPDAVRVIGPDFTVLKVNRAYCEQLGIAPAAAVGTPCHRASHAREEPCSPTLVTCPLVELAKDGGVLKCQHRHLHADGHELFVEVSAAAVELTLDGTPRSCVVESIRDSADQARLSHEQRLSEIGQLATGIAHEIHNPLASIHLALGAIRDELGKVAEHGGIAPYFAIVEREIQRCLDITARLLRLSEPSDANLTLVDVAQVTNDVLTLLRYEAHGSGVTLDTAFGPDLRLVATESDIGILVLNLAQNALHAMPGGGRLTVHAARVGEQLTLTVADTGVGIAPADLARIFWPFFSARADGTEGTGLGLAICRATVARLGGRIEVESMVGQGSRFTVTLPAAQ